jgi:HEPN domain-containing protein
MAEFNKTAQVEYWKTTAISDLETSEILIEKGKTLHGLFWCHLTIEKMLKALYVKVNNEFAPKTHNLIYLLNNTGLSLDAANNELLGILLKYQLEGRYPDYKPEVPDIEKVKEYLKRTKDLFKWLMTKL